MTPDIDKLQQNRNAILFIELAGLLHDVGKLSKKFLEYRMKWQDDPNGWGNDPHDNQFLEKHETETLKAFVEDSFKKDLSSLFQKTDFGEKDFSIWKAIEGHTKSSGGDITRLLQAADRSDSIIDRNNPLWSNEQREAIYRSNVFGYEAGRRVNLLDLEKARRSLYEDLNKLLKDYLNTFTINHRMNVITAIRNAFEQGLSDTTRPQNDTNLWEHSYAVASILKALVSHYLLTGVVLDGMEDGHFNVLKVQFRILGMGWDGLRFISHGYKIGDLVGRKKVLEEIKNKAREIVEWDYALGNEVYTDDDGIYFIVPECLEGHELANPITEHLISGAVNISGGELQPYFSLSAPTFTMTSLVSVIRDIRNKSQFPFDQGQKPEAAFKASLQLLGETETGIVCSICRLRPVKKSDDKERICETCLNRREKARSDTDIEVKKQTVFIEEIADKHGRVAAIVAHFNLDNWLNGNMVRTMFVTEAKGIDKEITQIGTVKERKFQVGEQIIRKSFNPGQNPPNYNYRKIKEDVETLFGSDPNKVAEACQKAILYDRRNNYNPDLNDIKSRWRRLKYSALCEHRLNRESYKIVLPNILCAKTPTPSTILDVWETTKEFFEENAQSVIESGAEERSRLRLILKNGFSPEKVKGTIEAVLPKGNRRCEILPVGGGHVEVIGEVFSEKAFSEWQGNIEIEGKSYMIEKIESGKVYRQFRIITINPNLFISLVPAEKAINLISEIYKEYIKVFGKAMGRLPFGIGTIFFDRPMPMFVVLDAAKRMTKNFNILLEKDRNLEIKGITEQNGTMSIDMIDLNDDRKIQWNLPLTLGNCASDTHHCYMLLANGHNAEGRKTYFRTIAGDVIHYSELKVNDRIRAYPNLFDFIYLDSNARRYEIMIEESKLKRVGTTSDGFASLPVFLDELDQKMVRVWNIFLKGKGISDITDTKVRNLCSLWSVKGQEWGPGGLDHWKIFIRDSLVKEFKLGTEDEAYILLEEMIKTGLLFETIEIYMRILKERIGEP